LIFYDSIQPLIRMLYFAALQTALKVISRIGEILGDTGEVLKFKFPPESGSSG